MVMTSVVISIVLTIVILLLSLLTISKGYGYKHTVDPKPDSEAKKEMHDKKSKNTNDETDA